MSQFSDLRESAGFEILDVVDQFDAGFQSVVRWENGAEAAPARILRALREIGKLIPSTDQLVENLELSKKEKIVQISKIACLREIALTF